MRVVDRDLRIARIRLGGGEAGLGTRHAGHGAVGSRRGDVQCGLRHEFLLEQILRAGERRRGIAIFGLGLLDARTCDLDARARAVELRRDVARIEPRDDVARLDSRSLGNAQPLQPPRGFR